MLIKWLRRNEQNHRNVEPSKTKPGKNGKYDQTNCQVKKLNWWKKIKNPTNKCPGPDSFINSVAQSCLTICNSTDCSMPDFPGYHQLSELAQTHVHQVGDAIQPSCPLSPTSPLTFNLSQHQDLFKWVSSSHQVAKVLELQLKHQSFQWIFRADFLQDCWFNLFAIQGTLRSRPQHRSSKASILRCSAFFIVQFSHPYMTSGKTIALTRRTFVGKVMSAF